MIILKKQTGKILGLKINSPSFVMQKNKTQGTPGIVAWAFVRDFFNYPKIENIDKKTFFYIQNDYYIIDNRGVNPFIYKICLVQNEKGFNDLIKNVKKSINCPKTIISATDSNFRIAIILNNIEIDTKFINFYKKLAQECCDYLINYITSNPEQIRL